MRIAIACCGVLFSVHAFAAQLDTEAMTVAFDSSELDLRNDRHELHGNVRITQGAMSIASEDATASALQTDNSRWTFQRSVHLQTADADLKSNTATARFANGALVQATASGTPATFEQKHAAAAKLAQGRAGQIEYDLAKGIVRLTNDVWFSYGGNEFRGNVIVYDLRQERVTVNAEGQNNGRVNITIKPRSGVKLDRPSSTVPPAKNENGA